ncbi:EmrB/QacA subfamily drug resistance transporter [Pseudonocardia eucalypti]|nr:EmrB/QacA subfamily drug resistance transporter [Pseudonocardia eucalypti]
MADLELEPRRNETRRSPGHPAGTADPFTPHPAKGWGLPLAVLIAGMFMSILDTSIVNVAMTSIRKDFGASTESVQWISTAYSLTEGVVVPASAWLGARFGLKRVYIWSLVLFTVASALCALAGGLGSLIFFRILQAIPGGVIPVTCQTILYRIVPRNRLGAAMGMYGVGVVVAPAIGPTLGGYLIEHFDWRAIFYVNMPIGILGTIAAVAVLSKFPTDRGRPFDLAGFACIAGALFALLLALEEGSSWGWTSYPVLILFAVAVNLLALFVVVELQVDHPLLNLRVFRHWPFVNSLVLVAGMMIGLFAVMFYIPVFLQSVQGLSALDAGLVLLPQGMVMAVLMPVAGQLYDRFGARWLAVAGLTLTGTGILMLSDISVGVPRGEVVLGTVVMAAGLGLGMMPVMTGGLSALPNAFTDVGSAISTLTQRVSSALGLAVLTAIVTADRAQLWADRSGLLAGSGADINPRVAQLQQQGDPGLIQLWQQLSNQVQTQAYGNAFAIAGTVTLAAVAFAFLLRSGRPAAGADKPMAH